MKALLREFAPTAIFAVIVITMLTISLKNFNNYALENGIQHAQLNGKLDLISYRLECLEATEVVVDEHPFQLEVASNGSVRKQIK